MGLANGLPRESIGHYTGLGQQILVELNPNILVRDAIRVYNINGPNSMLLKRPGFARAVLLTELNSASKPKQHKILPKI